MQLSITLYIYLLSHLLTSWLFHLTSFYSSIRATNLQTYLSSTNQLPALHSGLVEYQKSQAFFALTLHCAGIHALLGDGRTFEARSLQELHLTISLLRDAAATAVVCVVFGLWMLHRAGRRAWYTTLLSLAAVGVAGTAWGVTLLPLRNLKRLEPPEEPLRACGDLSPVTFCLDRDDGLAIWLEAVGLAICLAILVGMIFHQQRNSSSSTIISPQPATTEHMTEKPSTSSNTRTRSLLNRTKNFLYHPHLIETLLLLLTLITLVHLCTNSAFTRMKEAVN
jgi:hypothetical protein